MHPLVLSFSNYPSKENPLCKTTYSPELQLIVILIFTYAYVYLLHGPSQKPPESTSSIGSRGRRVSIVYYYHLQVSFHKHFQTWRQHHFGTPALKARELYGPSWNREIEGRGGGVPMPVWIEQLLRSFAQGKYFTNQALFWFCKCGLPISLGTHTQHSVCTHGRKRKSLAMWLGLLGRSTYPQLALTRTFVAILKSRKAVKQEKRGKKKARAAASWPCKSTGILLTIFNWKIFIIYQFVCSTNNNNRSSTRTTRAGAKRSRNRKKKRKSHS